eukprot:TRINITY_DN6804_c0_g1_i2.p1 TRINITY_DN6804_c0_g1~~TRINITY_DN6804_c0_g1_i2.p1  ORF type:complete len:752 (+),score=253.84 TRINITY_DN6804_c0_g1_i2:87-2342(+)
MLEGLEDKDRAVGAERASPRARGPVVDDDTTSVDSGWDGSGINFRCEMANFDTHGKDAEDKQTPAGTMTPPPQYDGHIDACPIRSPGERRTEDRLAQSWPPRTPGPSASIEELPLSDLNTVSGFTLDPGEGKSSLLPPINGKAVGSLGRAPIAPKRQPVKAIKDSGLQTETQNPPQVVIDNSTTITNASNVFCTVVVNGVQSIQCSVPYTEDGVAQTEAALRSDVNVFGERSGLFLQLMFYSPNFPQKPDYHIHGTLELLDQNDQIMTTIYLGLLEEQKQVEKKQHTVCGTPVKAKVILSSIPPVRVGPNEMQLVEEICDVLRNTRFNPGRGSLPSVLVQHRAKESPLYEKVVGKYFQNSWHTFMKAHDDVFVLFHYSQNEIKERNLGPFAKFNEARIVLKEHEKGDWKKADEMAALKHAQAEEGLKQFLIQTLEKRDYDQRELLEVLHGNQHFNHFLSPTFSILMRTLSRHKGTFITSTDPDQPTRVGLARPDQKSVDMQSKMESNYTGSKMDDNNILSEATRTTPVRYQQPVQPQYATQHAQRSPLLQFSMPQQPPQEDNSVGNLINDLGIQQRHRSWSKASNDTMPYGNPDNLKHMDGNTMLVASAVPIQTTVPAAIPSLGGQLMFDNRHMQQQVMLNPGAQNTPPMQFLDQNATVVVLKNPQQQLGGQLLQPQLGGQQVLLVNQPTGADASWVVTHQPTTQAESMYPSVLQTTPPTGPVVLSSNTSTPTEQGLHPQFYPQYLLSTSY